MAVLDELSSLHVITLLYRLLLRTAAMSLLCTARVSISL